MQECRRCRSILLFSFFMLLMHLLRLLHRVFMLLLHFMHLLCTLYFTGSLASHAIHALQINFVPMLSEVHDSRENSPAQECMRFRTEF